MSLEADEPVRPSWDATGIHGLHRVREWDTVTTVEAPGLTGDRSEFVALSRDEFVVEEGPGAVAPLADAVARELTPPYRAEAVRRNDELWAVAARRITVITLPGVTGNEIELASQGEERTLLIDGERQFGSLPALERPGHVVRARRIDGETWEVTVDPL